LFLWSYFLFKETNAARRLLSRTQGTSENTPFDFWSCGWANLSIQYKVKYPMKAFFSENCKQRYNDIFHLLIVLRYVQIELNSLWLTLKTQNQNSLVWHLRNAMSFFIDNFQYYIQIDVLEYKYQQLIRSILSSTDFQQIKHLHELFLADIQTHSFMLLGTAYQSIRNILSICVSFCLTVKEQNDENILRQFGKDFNEEIRLLFGILGMVQKHNALPHLGIFLTRLDFNRFLTNNNGSFGEF
jgi:gamma-tubulin complex component 4